MRDAIAKITRFADAHRDADGLFDDEQAFDAVLPNFIVLGECAARTSTNTRRDWPEIPWKGIKDFRNIVAHNYFGVDAEEVWQIIRDHLPDLDKRLAEVLGAP